MEEKYPLADFAFLGAARFSTGIMDCDTERKGNLGNGHCWISSKN